MSNEYSKASDRLEVEYSFYVAVLWCAEKVRIERPGPTMYWRPAPGKLSGLGLPVCWVRCVNI